GALPATVQRFAHDIAGAPAPGSQPALAPASAHPAAIGGRAYGLCTAWAHAKAHGTAAQRAVAFSRLAAAARGAGNLTPYCAAAPQALPPPPSPPPAPAASPPGYAPRPPAPHAPGNPTRPPSPHGPGAPPFRPTPHSTDKPSGPPPPRHSGH